MFSCQFNNSNEFAYKVDWLSLLSVLTLGEPFSDFSVLGCGSVGRSTFTIGAATTLIEVKRIESLYVAYDAVLRASIASLPSDAPLVMGLSGGRDSRHILLAAGATRRHLPRLVTSHHFLGRASEADVAVARLLADHFGSEIDVVNQPRDRFWVEWEKNAATGLETLSHSWGLALAERLNGHETLLDGMNGGVLFGRAGLMRAVAQQFGDTPPSFPALHDFVLNELVSNPHQALEPWLPAKLRSPTMLESLKEQLSACFSKYQDYPNPVQAFLHGEHVRRNTALFTHGLMKNKTVITPLNTPQMVAFALSLPWHISIDPKFQDKAISHCYPDAGQIPYAESIGTLPPIWSPDRNGEKASWLKIRSCLSKHMGQSALSFLDKNHQKLPFIQRTTLLAQAFYLKEQGSLPTSAVFLKAARLNLESINQQGNSLRVALGFCDIGVRIDLKAACVSAAEGFFHDKSY